MPGRSGQRVAIMMVAQRGRVCVGQEPVIVLPLSVVVSSVTASVWRLQTAQGKNVSLMRTSVM